MLKKFGFLAILLAAIMFVIPAPQAQAGVHFGIGIGVAPTYPAYPAYPYAYGYPNYYGAPYAPGYVAPYYGYNNYYFGWGGHYRHDRDDWHDHDRGRAGFRGGHERGRH
jgi:hypothetical protein